MSQVRTFLRASHGVAIIDYAIGAGLVTLISHVAALHGTEIALTLRNFIAI